MPDAWSPSASSQKPSNTEMVAWVSADMAAILSTNRSRSAVSGPVNGLSVGLARSGDSGGVVSHMPTAATTVNPTPSNAAGTRPRLASSAPCRLTSAGTSVVRPSTIRPTQVEVSTTVWPASRRSSVVCPTQSKSRLITLLKADPANPSTNAPPSAPTTPSCAANSP
ncbi:hypothetical protein GCM10023321_70110 [Pseudonocardia eucalypti]|uniref:Uncharacterized protein n=1 Tax=Pseudonocardia eucalypti TaxID=648755 RepID=A0ABP9R4Z6_9PSEU